ncbi:hypothetical protein FYK55_10735 [Roseiconus nitratireducens]|uniref:Uncharacterized protein n=1 Tax=Roseiconus nitratireducens TaxID=2605748 RepID=A0A5M6DBI0_9BACT|nr:hypothetical protein [Roseiconus nitratireducens]KAA5543672.1 hypothetical protein FYK55_10735 [Roseiconus nitratireducens]
MGEPIRILAVAALWMATIGGDAAAQSSAFFPARDGCDDSRATASVIHSSAGGTRDFVSAEAAVDDYSPVEQPTLPASPPKSESEPEEAEPTTAKASSLRLFKPQGPGGFTIPDSLSTVADEVRDKVDGAAGAMNFADFSGGVDPRRATTTTNGPSTAPTSVRDSSWMTNSPQSTNYFPSTAPVSTSGAASPPGMGTGVSPVGATQEIPGNGQSAGGQSGAGLGSSSNFGSPPSGVFLPPAMGAGRTDKTYGAEFGRTAATNGSPSAGDRPVYGPPTAAEAGFDPSLYDPARYNAGGSSSGTSARSASSSGAMGSGTLGMPGASLPPSNAASAYSQNQLRGGYGSSTTSGTQNIGANAGATQASTLPTTWTANDIVRLGAYFQIPANDPRLQNQAYVNQLYAEYRKRESQSATAGANVPPPAVNGINPPGSPFAGRPDQGSPFARRDSEFGSGSGSDRVASASDLLAPSSRGREDVDPRLSEKDIAGLPINGWSYDKYGNPIDKERNILDRFGNRVDDETAYELTIGRKHREAARETAVAKGQSGGQRDDARSQVPASVPPGIVNSAGQPQGIDPRIAMAGGTAGLSGRTNVNRPPSSGSDLGGGSSSSDSGSGPAANDSAPERHRSNPYVNVFLLCSLVANGFLFLWLHRLWYHHRDLIASSRMAASGLSSAD